MKTETVPIGRWFFYVGLMFALGVALSMSRGFYLVSLPIVFTIVFWNGGKAMREGIWAIANLPPRRYRPRDTGAGRWLEAPVAELDKSTVGKLLASRASRDPSLHVVVSSHRPPASTDALYDPELDG